MTVLWSISLYVVITLTTLFSIIYYLLRKYFDYWRIRNVPHAKPILFFGTNKEYLLGGLQIGQMAQKHYNSWPNEKLVGSFQSRWPEVIVRDPELIRHVLIKDFNHFVNREKPFNEEADPLLCNIFHLNTEKWRVLRNKISPAFTSGKLRNMFHLIAERGEQLKLYLDEEIKASCDIEVRDITAKFTTDSIGSCGFGIEMNTMKDSEAPFRQLGKMIFETGMIKIFKNTMRIMFPELANLLRLRIFNKKVQILLSQMVKRILEQRQHKVSTRRDFIDLMIEIRNSGQITGQTAGNKGTVDIAITDDIVTAQAFVFFAAGSETSSMTLTFALYELAWNHTIQDRAYEEIRNILEKYDGKITYEILNEMKYLDMIINESMRKYPALAVLTRECTVPYTFPNTNVTIDTNCSVVIPVLALHHDPQYYPNPKVFDPKRFSPEAIQSLKPFVYLPFGDGPRNCIGARFGKAQSLVGLITFIKNFKVDICDKTDNEISIDPSSYVTRHTRGIWLKVTPR